LKPFRPVPAPIMSGLADFGLIGQLATSGCMVVGIIVPPMSCADIITAAVTAAIGGDLRLAKPINYRNCPWLTGNETCPSVWCLNEKLNL